LNIFGEMVDRPQNYEYYAELGDLIDEISIIMFYFDTNREIIYSETDPKQYAADFLKQQNIHILSDGKDIDVVFGIKLMCQNPFYCICFYIPTVTNL